MVQQIKKKIAKGAIDRIDDIEATIPNLINAFNQGFASIDQRVGSLTELLEALVEIVGAAEVKAAIEKRRLADAHAQADRARVWLQQELAAGRLEQVETVFDSENCVVVGVETSPEGAQLGAGRTQLSVDRIIPEVRAALIGNPVGTRVKTPGGFLEVLEIYERKEVPAELAPLPAEVSPVAPTEPVAEDNVPTVVGA